MKKRVAVAGLLASWSLLTACADDAQDAPTGAGAIAEAGRSGAAAIGGSGGAGSGDVAGGAGAGGSVLLPDEGPPSGDGDVPDLPGGMGGDGGQTSGGGGAAGQAAGGGGGGAGGATGEGGATGAGGATAAAGAGGKGGTGGQGGSGGGKGGSAGSPAGGKGGTGAGGKGGAGGAAGKSGAGAGGKGGGGQDPAIIVACNAEDGWPDAMRQMECNIVKLTNEVRAKGTKCLEKGAGGALIQKTLPPAPALALHRDLRESSRAHSVDMGKKQYFSHTSQPGGQQPDDRMKAAGYKPAAWSENIAAISPSQADARRFVDEWLASKSGHCSALMSKTVTQIGVGVANGKYEGNNMVFATQNFGRPKD